MPITEMVVMVAITSALVLGFIALLRLWSAAITHKTIRRAVDSNAANADALLAQLTAPRDDRGDDRIAIILVALGVAMAGASLVIGDPGLIRLGIAAALFPLIVGAALWLRFRALERNRRDAGQ
jgi:membrane associated rhomboid family serine protease